MGKYSKKIIYKGELALELKDCLKHFIQLELKAAKFYEEIAKNNKGEIAQVAKKFQKEETSHAQKLKELLTTAELVMDSTINKEVLLMSQYGIDVNLFGKELKVDTRKQLFTFALQAEKDSILMYQELVSQVPKNSKPYRLFSDLIKEERGHMFFILKQLHELS
ncbi:ferritin family protein [Proteinivorax tanatarense]|uniref:Ferritin family protein n=1 Tax=Proteinivorax tanatarense TaxID=1260629 RepID=A0AAU7VMI1_9FIRM